MAKFHSGYCNISLGNENTGVDDLVGELEKITSKPLLKVQEKLKKVEDKKAKKKEKKKKGLSIDVDSSVFGGKDAEEVIIDDSELDVMDYMQLVGLVDEEEEDEFDEIIKEQRGARYEAKKKDDIKKDFADNLALLYNLLDSAKTFEKSIEKTFEESNKGRRTQGYSKYTADMAQAVITSRKATLDIIKEINAVKKSIIDLQIKSDSKKAANAGLDNTNSDAMVNSYINTIMNSYGRSNIIEQIRGSQIRRSAEPIVVDATESDYGHYAGSNDFQEIIDDVTSSSPIDPKYHEEIMDKISSRLDNEDNQFRSEEGSLYIEFEKFEPKILVKRCTDDGQWHFIAVSKDNQELYGYPVPSKQSAGKMQFSSDGTMCTDSKGRSYKVINYFRADEQ